MNNYWKILADTDTYLNNSNNINIYSNITDTIKKNKLQTLDKNHNKLQSKFEVINEKLK